MKKSAIVLTFIWILVCLMSYACGSPPNVVLDKVLSVSDFPYTIGDKQAVTLLLGGNKDNYFDITIHRGNVYRGFSVSSQQKSNSNIISAGGSWDGKMYCQSLEYDTFIKFSINELDIQNKVAKVCLSGKFINIKTLSEFISIPETQITIITTHFENLIKKI